MIDDCRGGGIVSRDFHFKLGFHREPILKAPPPSNNRCTSQCVDSSLITNDVCPV